MAAIVPACVFFLCGCVFCLKKRDFSSSALVITPLRTCYVTGLGRLGVAEGRGWWWRWYSPQTFREDTISLTNAWLGSHCGRWQSLFQKQVEAVRVTVQPSDSPLFLLKDRKVAWSPLIWRVSWAFRESNFSINHKKRNWRSSVARRTSKTKTAWLHKPLTCAKTDQYVYFIYRPKQCAQPLSWNESSCS